MKKTILFLAALVASSNSAAYAYQVRNRLEVGMTVGMGLNNVQSQKSKNSDAFKLKYLTDSEYGDTNATKTVKYTGWLDGQGDDQGPGSIANLANVAVPLLEHTSTSALESLKINKQSFAYDPNNCVARNIPGVVVGGMMSYVMGIPCSNLFAFMAARLNYNGSKTALQYNQLSQSMILGSTIVEVDGDVVNELGYWNAGDNQNTISFSAGQVRNNLALNVEFGVGAAITKNTEISLAVGYTGIRSKLYYANADFAENSNKIVAGVGLPPNNLVLTNGFISSDSPEAKNPIILSQKSTKSVWQSGVSLSAAVSHRITDSFLVRLRGQVDIMAAKEFPIEYNPYSYAPSKEEYNGQLQKGALRLQNTIKQVALELVYTMDVDSTAPGAA